MSIRRDVQNYASLGFFDSVLWDWAIPAAIGLFLSQVWSEALNWWSAKATFPPEQVVVLDLRGFLTLKTLWLPALILVVVFTAAVYLAMKRRRSILRAVRNVAFIVLLILVPNSDPSVHAAGVQFIEGGPAAFLHDIDRFVVLIPLAAFALMAVAWTCGAIADGFIWLAELLGFSSAMQVTGCWRSYPVMLNVVAFGLLGVFLESVRGHSATAALSGVGMLAAFAEMSVLHDYYRMSLGRILLSWALAVVGFAGISYISFLLILAKWAGYVVVLK